MKENIEYSLLVVFSCLIIVALITPLVKKIAIHINALDIPDARKVHNKPIPRLGGLGIFMGFLAGYMIFAKNTIQMNSILIGSFIIVLTGIIDDIKPYLKEHDSIFVVEITDKCAGWMPKSIWPWLKKNKEE